MRLLRRVASLLMCAAACWFTAVNIARTSTNTGGTRVCGVDTTAHGMLTHYSANRTPEPVHVSNLSAQGSGRFAAVQGIMVWVSQFDTDRNALLCSHEVKHMPAEASVFIPRFDRLVMDVVTFPGGGRLCLRFNMVEAALFQLPRRTLDTVASEFSRPMSVMNVDPGCAYAFEGIPDFQRHSQWPYISQDGIESAATFVYHGRGALVSSVWRPEDVQSGDIVSVRGAGAAQQFWDTVHPHINAKYIVFVQAEGEDVLPGRFKARLADHFVGKFYVGNPDEQNAGGNSKLKPLPLGQLWKTDGEQLLEIARSAPPILGTAYFPPAWYCRAPLCLKCPDAQIHPVARTF